MIFIIIFAILAYRKARDSGRSGLLWTGIMIGAFFGAQLAIGIGFLVFVAFGIILYDWPEETFDSFVIPLNIVATIGSFVSGLFVLHYLGRAPKEEKVSEPPPPPDFGSGKY